jgi:hypothetical protein
VKEERMKGCGDIRDAILRGEALADADLRAHLSSCSACALLAESPDAFARAVRTAESDAPIDLDALLARVKSSLAGERGARGWLRSRPTWMRRSISIAASTILSLFGLVAVRPDLGAYPPWRMAITLGAFIVPLLFTIVLSLRPAYRPALKTEIILASSVASLGIVLLLSVLPPAHEAHAATIAMAAADGGGGAMPCFFIGVLVSLPVLAIARVLDHRATKMVVVLSAVAAGLTANVTLQLHCPATAPTHLLLGHFSVALVVVVVVALLASLPWEAWSKK